MARDFDAATPDYFHSASAPVTAAQRASTTRAGILTQNYQNERQLQQNAPGMISSAISQPEGRPG